MRYIIIEEGKDPVYTRSYPDHFPEGAMVIHIEDKDFTTDGINWIKMKVL
jgi:hypothetical protein